MFDDLIFFRSSFGLKFTVVLSDVAKYYIDWDTMETYVRFKV